LGALHYLGKDGAVLSADLSNAKAGHDESRMIELVNRWLLSYAG
jgi:hypothetical protein